MSWRIKHPDLSTSQTNSNLVVWAHPKVETLVAQTEAGWAAHLKEYYGDSDKTIQKNLAKRKRDGNCILFTFAMEVHTTP